jgi:hypothetical protein
LFQFGAKLEHHFPNLEHHFSKLEHHFSNLEHHFPNLSNLEHHLNDFLRGFCLRVRLFEMHSFDLDTFEAELHTLLNYCATKFIDIGNHLLNLHSTSGWKESGESSMAKYCLYKFGLSKPTMYRYMKSAKVFNSVIINPHHTRYLTATVLELLGRVPSQTRQNIWDQFACQANPTLPILRTIVNGSNDIVYNNEYYTPVDVIVAAKAVVRRSALGLVLHAAEACQDHSL